MAAVGQNINLLMTSNKRNISVFEVGPSVKFVSAIKDAISNQKMGVVVAGGGPKGVW